MLSARVLAYVTNYADWSLTLYRYLFKPENIGDKPTQFYLRAYYDTIQMCGYPNVCECDIYINETPGGDRTASHRVTECLRWLTAMYARIFESHIRTHTPTYTCAHTPRDVSIDFSVRRL